MPPRWRAAAEAALEPVYLPFLAAFSARFSFRDFSGFFLVSFFWFMPLDMAISCAVGMEDCA
jgi:hypothetical protein